MASWRNEVEQGVNSIIPESWVTLDTRLFRQDVIVLSLKVGCNLREAM